jgi:putative ABC transport system permease protein
MISAWQMALLHFRRQRLQSFILVISLAVALVGTSLLLRLYSLSENRFSSLAPNVQAVVGPKSGGIDILLGALNLENKYHEMLPLNLFETLRAGADVHFEDGSLVSSKQFTKNVVPLLYVGSSDDGANPVIATDESFLQLLNGPGVPFPASGDLLIGAQLAKSKHIHAGDTFDIQLKPSGAKKSQKVLGVLPEQRSAWDYGIFVDLKTGQQWLPEAGLVHPVWKDKVLSYFLIQMEPQGFKPLQSLINDRSVAQMIWVETEKTRLQELSGSAGNLGGVLVGVILVLAAFSIFGMMSLRSENLRISIATLEAIGYSRSFIFSWMSLESLLTGLSAAVLALVIDLISFSTIKNMLNSTWLIPLEQASDATWIYQLFLGALVFSFLGNMLGIASLFRVSIHQELKSG